MKRILFTLLTALCSFPLVAQETVTVKSVKGETEVIELPEGMLSKTDSLYHDWLFKNYIDLTQDCNHSAVGPAVSDEVYRERLRRLPVVISMPYNSVVKGFLDLYANRLRSRVAFMLSANNLYMPIIEEALALYDLPMELKYLPVIESAMNPQATSRQGAVGLWQFMLRTGQIYGLRSNSLMDERRDPLKSSRAAARYLSDLYKIYGDWSLVLAAYNCGPGTVNKAIKRAGGKKDYWEIYNFLPQETRGYVPAFIAANYIMNYYCEHNIAPYKMQMPEGTDTVHVHRNLTFQQVARVSEVPVEQLRSLNPELKRDIIPGLSEAYALRLPKTAIGAFLDNVKQLYNEAQTAEMATVNITDELISSSSSSTTTKAKKTAAKYHTVRKGETLASIAKRNGITTNQLKRLNGLKRNTVRVGQRLRVK